MNNDCPNCYTYELERGLNRIKFCPLHDSAIDLLRASEATLYWITGSLSYDEDIFRHTPAKILHNAITKAKEKKYIP